MNPLAFRRSLQEAWGYTAEVSEYRKSSHAVYRLRYHFVFITKYRKPALRGEIGKEVRDLTREICRSLDIEIVKGHVRPDHVHLLLDVPPSDQRQIEFPQRRLEIPTQGLKKKSCSRPLRRPFPRSSFL